MSLRKCPACGAGKLAVIDSRVAGDGEVCRRRYRCSCGARFTTMEVMMGDVTYVRPGKHAPHHGSGKLLGELAAKRIIGGSYDEIK